MKAQGIWIILTGAAMMLIAMALDLYKFYKHWGWTLDFDDLSNQSSLRSRFELDLAPNWFGASLPLILVIVFASITILSTLYALATGKRFKQLWGWLSLLSVAALMANYFYLRFSLGVFTATPYVGWWLAFIGAIAIGIVAITIGAGSRKRSYS